MVCAACHIHSDWSYDGKWPLPRLAEEFSRRNYRVLLMSEHDRGFSAERLARYREACAQASSDKILVVPGIEYSDADNTNHVLVWGPVPFLGENLPTESLLRAVRAANGVAVFAHPRRRNAWKNFDPRWAESLLGIEVWNRKTDGWAPSRVARSLLANNALLPFAGMDFHDKRQLFPLLMGLEMNSEITENAVLDTLRARRCRAMAFGRPVQGAMQGWMWTVLNSAERCRRSAAAAYRSLRK